MVAQVGQRRRRGEVLGLGHLEIALVEELALCRGAVQQLAARVDLAVRVEEAVLEVVERVQLGDVDVGQQDLAGDRVPVLGWHLDVLGDRRGLPGRDDEVVDLGVGGHEGAHQDDDEEARAMTPTTPRQRRRRTGAAGEGHDPAPAGSVWVEGGGACAGSALA